MTLEPGSSIGHYRILERLGAGGMGEVLLAEDPRLGRKVAIKVLPPQRLADEGRRKRFLREARAAAAVDHPHVVHIYEVEERDDGFIFLVMQHVEGRTVRQRLMKEPLDPQESLRVAAEVAEALGAAHEKGVIHRDVKPDNIMIDGSGHARLLDFGLARILEDEAPAEGGTQMETLAAQTTTEGTVLGTTAYMSPEQARGADLDARSDLFSLGITLYEMLTRRHPFAGRTAADTVDSLLNRPAPPLQSVVGGMPPEADWILSKLLSKKAGDRYQSAAELLVDLRKLSHTFSISGAVPLPPPAATGARRRGRLMITITATVLILGAALLAWRLLGPGGGAEPGGAAVPTAGRAGQEGGGAAPAEIGPRIRLAVLPLQNVGSDRSLDFLGFALADATISKLSYLDDVAVRPSSFVQRYRETPPESPREVGDALNVDHLITGSLLSQGERLRVNVQLVDLTEGTVAWEETIDATTSDLLQVQDAVVARIVEGMRLRLSPQEEERIARERPASEEAFDLYLRGVAQPDTQEGILEAIRLGDRLVEMEPGFAPGWSLLSDRRYSLALYTDVGTRRDYELALEFARKALDLNPSSPESMQRLATLLAEIGEHREAYRMVSAWIRENPSMAQGHFSLSYLFRYTGLLDRAADALEKAITLEPGNPLFRSGSVVYAYLGRPEEADRFFQLDPDSTFTLLNRYAALNIAGRFQEARQMILDAAAGEEGRSRPAGLFPEGALAYARGDIRKAQSLTLQLMEEDRVPDSESRYYIAANLALYGLPDAALKTLQEAVQRGFYCVQAIERDRRLDIIRQRPEFEEILQEARKRHREFLAYVEAQ